MSKRAKKRQPEKTATQPPARKPSGPPWLLISLAVLFVLSGVVSARRESSTWDETHYLGVGEYLLQTGRWNIPDSILHPPLSFYLSSLPIRSTDLNWNFFARPAPDPSDPAYVDFLGTADVPRGRALLSSPANDGDLLLTESRLTMIGVGVLLGACVWAWSSRRYGLESGILAAALVAVDPNLAAHSHLVTPDICVTTFSCIAIYYLWRFLAESRMRHAWWAGAGLGLAVLSKYTGLLMLPVAGFLVALWYLCGRPVLWRGCALILGVAVVVWLAAYRFNPAPYFQGLAFQQAHAAGGQSSFLMGRVSGQGFWDYFLVAFAIKTPLGLLILLVASLAVAVRRWHLRTLLDDAFLLVPSLAVFAFYTVEHQSIGLRYILPVYPFLIVLASRMGTFFRAAGPGRWIVGALAVWVAGSSLWVFPHPLAYFNELIGGPSHGYRYLVDSNLDWGQELKDLKAYMDVHRIDKVNLAYFGSDDPARYGIAYDALPSNLLPETARPAPDPLPAGSWVAVSATLLEGAYVDAPVLRSLRDRTPTAVLDYSLFLYHLTPASEAR